MDPVDQALPDHPIRRSWLFQALDRGWRLAIYWFAAVGVAYVCFVGHLIAKPMDEPYGFMILGFAAALIGNKTFEKVKGVS